MVNQTKLELLVRDFCKDNKIELRQKASFKGMYDYWVIGENADIVGSYDKNENNFPHIESAMFIKEDVNKVYVTSYLDDSKIYSVQLLIEVDSFDKELVKMKASKDKKDSLNELSNYLRDTLKGRGCPVKEDKESSCYIIESVYTDEIEEIRNFVYNQVK